MSSTFKLSSTIEERMNMRNLTRFIFAFLCMIMSLGACTTVEPGETGVQVCWGTMDEKVYPSGFYTTVFCNVHRMSTRTQTYTMAGAGREQQADGSVQVLTQDQLSVSLDVSVQFHLNDQGKNVLQVYRYLGERYDSDIVHPLVRTAVRDAASEFNAIQLVDQRSHLQTRMQSLVNDRLISTLRGRQIAPNAVVIDNILLRNIDLPNSLEESIANVQRQRQETAQREQAGLTATQEAARLRIEAEGASNAMLIRTRADAEASRIRAQAQADSNRMLAQSLTPEVLRLRQIDVMSALMQNTNSRVIMVPAGQTPTLLMPSDPQR